MRIYLLTAALLLLYATLVYADYKYILGLKSDATDEEYKTARKNIESMGGKVTYEFHSTMKAFAFIVPDNTIATKEQPAFVDFLEEDKTVHIYDK